MADKLTSQQIAQLAVLDTLPPRLELVHRLIEELAAFRADDTLLRRLGRTLDEGKRTASSIGQAALAETMGMMAMMVRRGGDRQTKIRGLREGLGSLRINYEGAVRQVMLSSAPKGPSASSPESDR